MDLAIRSVGLTKLLLPRRRFAFSIDIFFARIFHPTDFMTTDSGVFPRRQP
jgi:hypothetical protein